MKQLIDKRQTRDAVKKLRLAMSLTQVQFAPLLGVGLSTLQRYEQLVPPRGLALRHLFEIAQAEKQTEIAKVFREAWIDSIGGELPKVYAPTTEPKEALEGLD